MTRRHTCRVRLRAQGCHARPGYLDYWALGSLGRAAATRWRLWCRARQQRMHRALHRRSYRTQRALALTRLAWPSLAHRDLGGIKSTSYPLGLPCRAHNGRAREQRTHRRQIEQRRLLTQAQMAALLTPAERVEAHGAPYERVLMQRRARGRTRFAPPQGLQANASDRHAATAGSLWRAQRPHHPRPTNRPLRPALEHHPAASSAMRVPRRRRSCPSPAGFASPILASRSTSAASSGTGAASRSTGREQPLVDVALKHLLRQT